MVSRELGDGVCEVGNWRLTGMTSRPIPSPGMRAMCRARLDAIVQVVELL